MTRAGMDLAELRRLAEAATPGPWTGAIFDKNGPEMAYVEDVTAATGHVVCFGHDYDEYGHASIPDAAYIAAANPATILVLLNRIAEARSHAENIRRWVLTTNWATDDIAREAEFILVALAASPDPEGPSEGSPIA